MTIPPVPVQVDKWTLRRLFNSGRFYERVLSGELSALVVYRRLPSPLSNQPPGTMSEEVEYYSATEVVARVHQFALADGNIGSSGRPDPKVLVWEGTLYVLKPNE